MPCSRAAVLSVLTIIVTCALPGAAAMAAPATPTFGSKTAVDVNTASGLPKSVTKGNFNNDGYDDAAITSSFTNRDSEGVLWTNISTYEYVGGPAGLTRLGYNQVGGSYVDDSIDTTGDVNGDGTDDVIRAGISTQTNSSSLAAIDFAAAGGGMENYYGTSMSGVLTDVVVGNFLPADNALEIAVRAGSGPVHIYDVSGSTLVDIRMLAAPAGRLGVLDYDTAAVPADGADDLLVGATSSGPVALYLNDAGIFTARADLMTATSEPGATVGFGRGDLDGDGRDDFATTARTAAGAASFAGALSSAFGSYVHTSDSAVSTAGYPALAPVVGNFLSGGRDDSVVFADAANIFSYATGDGTSTRTSFALDGPVRAGSALDVNGDGRDDLVTIGTDGSAQTYYSVIANTEILSAPSALTSSQNASFTFESDVSSATFECRIDAGAYETCASPKLYGTLSDAQHTFTVRAMDASGTDATPATYAWTVDATAPQTTIATKPAGRTTATAATFTFSSNEPGATFQCKLDNASYTVCGSPKAYTGLTDGPHTFDVRAIDSAGNVDQTPDSYGWVIDRSAPSTTITTRPANPTNATAATFAFTSDDATATFECRRDNQPFATCTTPVTYSTLSAGQHTFDVRAADDLANTDQTPDGYTWTVDVTAPQTTITAGPEANAVMSSTSATFAFSSDDATATFQCVVDDEPFAPCSSPKTATGLDPQVEHNFFVRATDVAGNVDETVAYRYWVIDQSTPDTTITSAPDTLTTSHSASFAFSTPTISDATFQCSLDAADYAPCDTPAAYSDLADGEHTFDVRAVNTQELADDTPARHTWTVDSSAPVTTITAKPAAVANSTSATFAFSSDAPDATLECQFDAAAFAVCTSPATYSGLAQGSHTFAVRATDTIGNAGEAASHTWVVDTVAPTTTITDIPASPSNSSDVTVTFSSDDGDATFECKLDDAAFAPCSSPKGYTDLSDGQHDFEVRAVDSAGNISDGDAEIVDIDTTGADTTIDAGPSGVTSDTSATFAFSTTEAANTFGTFECRLDDAAFAPCESALAYNDLSDGEHTFQVRGSDDLGNTNAPSARTWTVDTTMPARPALIAGPQGTSVSTTATFEFTGEAGSTFECSLDGAPLTACTSPVTYAGLADGAHTFTVRQIDSAGNAGTTSTTAFAVEQPAGPTPTPAPTVPTPLPTTPTEPVLVPGAPDAGSLRLIVARRGTLRNGAVPVGCELNAGTLASCSVRAYANNVRVGSGTRTFTGGRLGAVRVKLTARGLRLLRRVGGVRLAYRASATTAAAKTLRARAISRVLPLRAAAVPTDGVFGAGSARLTAAGKRYVTALAADLTGTKRLVCTGHTDSVGSAASNRRLGFDRAKTVCGQLRNGGVRAELHSQSAGESAPRASNGTARGRALNRRVELTVSYR